MVGENVRFVKSEIAFPHALGYNVPVIAFGRVGFAGTSEGLARSGDVIRGASLVRVIAGTAKGKTLKAVPGEGTRPITDRVKESLFNILSWRVPDCRFLDLYAGTGSVGIEALSRDAQEAVFVEKAAKAVRTVRENLRITGMGHSARVVREDVFRFIDRTDERYDIIYVAPPQYQNLWSKTLLALDERPLSSPDGVVVAQIFPKEFEPLPLRQYTLTDQRTYGSTMLCFYAYTAC
jgi:16S rRNA (guanine(966)-N(2))-methyltransferase RsmD